WSSDVCSSDLVMHVYLLLAQAQACHTRLTVGIELHRLALVVHGRYRIRCAYDQIQRTGLIDVESLPGTHLPAVQDAAAGDADLDPADGRESDDQAVARCCGRLLRLWGDSSGVPRLCGDGFRPLAGWGDCGHRFGGRLDPGLVLLAYPRRRILGQQLTAVVGFIVNLLPKAL